MIEYNFPVNTKSKGWHWVKFVCDTGNKYEALTIYRKSCAEQIRAYDMGQCWSVWIESNGTKSTR